MIVTEKIQDDARSTGGFEAFDRRFRPLARCLDDNPHVQTRLLNAAYNEVREGRRPGLSDAMLALRKAYVELLPNGRQTLTAVVASELYGMTRELGSHETWAKKGPVLRRLKIELQVLPLHYQLIAAQRVLGWTYASVALFHDKILEASNDSILSARQLNDVQSILNEVRGNLIAWLAPFRHGSWIRNIVGRAPSFRNEIEAFEFLRNAASQQRETRYHRLSGKRIKRFAALSDVMGNVRKHFAQRVSMEFLFDGDNTEL